MYNQITNIIKTNPEKYIRFSNDNLKKLCSDIDYIYKCWDCYEVNVRQDDTQNIVVSLKSWDAMVVNYHLDGDEIGNGMGMTDETFYDVAKKAEKIQLINDDCNICIEFVFSNI